MMHTYAWVFDSVEPLFKITEIIYVTILFTLLEKGGIDTITDLRCFPLPIYVSEILKTHRPHEPITFISESKINTHLASWFRGCFNQLLTISCDTLKTFDRL